MAHVYFNCCNHRTLLLDQSGADVDDLIEASAYAARAVQSLLVTASDEDWRKWVLHVSDELGTEVLEMPFSFIIGKSH